MALVIADLKAAMLAATEGQTDAETAMAALGNAIATYIKNNADVNFSWAGTKVGDGSTDPTTSGTGKFTELTITLTKSNSNSRNDALSQMNSELYNGFTSSEYNLGSNFLTFDTTPASFGTTGISSIEVDPAGADRDECFEALAIDIITWLKAQTPLATCSGFRAMHVFSGVGTVTSIS